MTVIDITRTIDLLAVSVGNLYNVNGVRDIREMLVEKIRQLIDEISE